MKDTGQEIWAKAKKLIPGGTQLLSKRPERFLPGLWPTYYSKAKGCEVWDMDGRKFYDFAQMGVGSCTLGYADDYVSQKVKAAVDAGSMCTLNAPEEIQLAEKLIELHPWAQMARFARTGGEACSIAVRIGRAAAGKDRVLFCGYHGWHDWYLSANLHDDNSLDGQLLPGLKPKGVPRNLKGTALTFEHNNLASFEAAIKEYGKEIGVIYMEPGRSNDPAPGFLEAIRDTAKKIGAVLIFDEVTSGFRMNMGGIHRRFGVDPDIAVFAKALGNGHPISAVIGRREVMEAAQETFISSTYWTEKVGFVAALATLEKLEKENVPERLIHYGNKIGAGWRRLGEKHGIPLHVDGLPPLIHIGFKTKDPLATQTLYALEMLKAGYLVGAAAYTTFAYSDAIVDGYLQHSDAAFAVIAKAIKQDNVNELLPFGPLQAGFKRLS